MFEPASSVSVVSVAPASRIALLPPIIVPELIRLVMVSDKTPKSPALIVPELLRLVRLSARTPKSPAIMVPELFRLTRMLPYTSILPAVMVPESDQARQGDRMDTVITCGDQSRVGQAGEGAGR